MKISAACLILFAPLVWARPEISPERKYEDANTHYTQNYASLPETDRIGKKQTFDKGTEIPVKLVFGDETSVNGSKRAVRSEEYAEVLNKVLGIEARSKENEIDESEDKHIKRRIEIHTILQPAYNPIQVVNFNNEKILDEYFPIVVNNPFNTIWTAFTNIIEYGPEADICKKEVTNSRKKRSIEKQPNYREYVFDGRRDETVAGPHIMRLKVRKGGVAIAGPGGIATAGSGGTAIVGPGGTAYTSADGTAVVGPGGRVFTVPSFPPTQVTSRSDGSLNTFSIPPGAKFIANGPYIYYPNSPTVRQ